MSSSSHTEKPTPGRLKKAREEGNFFSSRELVAAAQFLIFLTVTSWFFSSWLTGMKSMLRTFLEGAFEWQVSPVAFPTIVRDLLQRAFTPVLVIGALTCLGTLASHLAITQLGFSAKKLSIDFKRFNPASKLKNIARQGPMGALQAAVMLILFAAAIYSIAKQNSALFFTLPFTSLDAGIAKVGSSLKTVLWKAGSLFVVFGLFDFVRQRRQYMKDLHMTKQEVKEEHKENEGNPHIKGKIRRLQRDSARRRMMQEVATATAVIVNPTHFAVALKYDHLTMATPIVVAKGKNFLALRIRQRALDHGVPLVENPPLAQALYKSSEVGREIPAHFYRAIAEVLGYIYRLSRRRY